MFTASKKQALLLTLAAVLVALATFTSSLRDAPALAAGLEIISGNDRAAIFGPIMEPVKEPVLLAGIRIKGSGTQVAF